MRIPAMTTKSKTCPICGKIIKLTNGMFVDHVVYSPDFKIEVICQASGKYISEANKIKVQS